jgi:iron complex transport system substrate-binding protein
MLNNDDHTPNRIVSAAPNLTEILFSLGLGQNIVAVPQYSTYPPETQTLPKIGSFFQPSIEAVIAQKPDLTITLDFPQQKNLADRLDRMGYNTQTLKIETVEQLYQAIDQIGEASNSKGKSDELIANIKTELNIISAKASQTEKPKVLWVVQREPLRVAGVNTFINDMIELAGGQNAIGQTLHQYPPIGSEQILATQPDVIIEASMVGGDIVQQQIAAIEHFSKFKNIPAVVSNKIFVVDGDTVSQLGPRLGQGVKMIANCLTSESK